MMTLTITKNIYNINELSEQAKQQALFDYQSDISYSWGNENEKTLRAFESIFPIKIKDWEYGHHKHISFVFTGSEEIEELTGIRLMTYLYNNYSHSMYKGKYYSTKGYYDENKKFHYKKRYSKVMFENDCVLTGYYIDYDIMQPIYNFLKNPSNNITFYELMEDCLNSWVKACHNDYENYFSMESFIETSEVNEWEYDENGKLI